MLVRALRRSFTAAAVPIGFTAAIQGQSLLSPDFARLLGLGLFTQAGANFVNSCAVSKCVVIDWEFDLSTKILLSRGMPG